MLRVGAGDAATLAIDEIGAHGIQARLTVDNLFAETTLASIPGAEADAIASTTFAGDPARVYFAFVPVGDGGGDAVALIALFDDRRVELRLLRSGPNPLYAIFALDPG